MKSNEEIRVPKGKYSEQEIERRVRNNIANSAIEGIILTNEEIDRNKRFLRGELSKEEALVEIMEEMNKR